MRTERASSLMAATVYAHVVLSLFTDIENFSVFKPDARHEAGVNTMLDQVVAWGGAESTEIDVRRRHPSRFIQSVRVCQFTPLTSAL